MDSVSLQTFVTIAETGSFSIAAERLHLTQPAISKRIAALETALGTRLFDRLGRQVLLTEAGQVLLPRARRILAEFDDSRRAMRNLSGEISGSLVVATSHHIGLHRLPSALRDFVARHPNVELDMRFLDSELGCAAVARARAELGVVTLPPNTRPPLTCLPLWDDPLSIVLPPDHPLSAAASVTPQQLAAYPAILPGEITFTRGIIDDFFKRRGLVLKLAFATNYLETIKMMVAVGLGWSILPQSMLDADLGSVALQDFQLSRRLGVVLHKDRTLSNAGKAFLDILREHADP